MIQSDLATEPLLRRVQRVQSAMQRAGIEAIDMRRAGTLETDILLPQKGGESVYDAPTIERLEGAGDEIQHRVIERRNETGFRWFLDGSQKTMPVWRIGVVPIVVSIAVAALLERQDDGTCTIVDSSLRESLVWIVPEQTGNPELRRTVDILREHGEWVEDPLNAQDNYQQLAGMYEQVLFYANETAGKMRANAEYEVARLWSERVQAGNPGAWLVIDGRLPIDTPNAVGLIKEPTGHHLIGTEANELLSLRPGYRTTAYRISSRASARTHWYQRMWPADGVDPRRALIRIEANGDMTDPDEISAIATWLMAERIPRPTADSRWPTLLYPVHLLERMLKRRINGITAGWPV